MINSGKSKDLGFRFCSELMCFQRFILTSTVCRAKTEVVLDCLLLLTVQLTVSNPGHHRHVVFSTDCCEAVTDHCPSGHAGEDQAGEESPLGNRSGMCFLPVGN